MVIIGLLLLSSIASLRFGEIPTFESIFFNSVSEGYYAGHATPGVIDAINSGDMNYEFGKRFALGVLAFIPRFIFPAKDEYIYNSLNDIGQVAPLGATSILAEVYLQGGSIAVIIWFLMLGFISQKLLPHINRDIFDKNRICLRVIFYVIFIASFIPHFRDGIISCIKMFIQLAIVALFLVALGPFKKEGWKIHYFNKLRNV